MKEGCSRLLLKQVEEEMNSQQLQALVVYEMVSTLCSGISQVEAVSGHAKFTLALDGLDIFQTLTQSPKFKDLIDEVERERKSEIHDYNISTLYDVLIHFYTKVN